MPNEENTDWGRSVAGVVRRGDDVLLVRHTYGGGKGKLIIPGGYLHNGESPEDAVVREILEETSVRAVPRELVGIRFNQQDWYVIFRMDYLDGTPTSDNDENSEAVFRNIYEMMVSPECPDLTRIILRSVIENESGGFIQKAYQYHAEQGKPSFYSMKPIANSQ